MRCETLKRVFRHCPGQQPVLVQEERIQEEGDGPLSSSPFPQLGGPSASPSPWGLGGQHPFDLRGGTPEALPLPGFGDAFAMLHRMEQMMGSLFSDGPPIMRHPPGAAPPREQIPGASPPQPPPRVRVHET